MENINIKNHIDIVRNIKNINTPTKESIQEYVDQHFGRIDNYLKTFIKRRPDSKIIIDFNIEKTSNHMYQWSMVFDFHGILSDFSVQIDNDTPDSWLPQAIATLFDKAKSILSKEVEKLHDNHS